MTERSREADPGAGGIARRARLDALAVSCLVLCSALLGGNQIAVKLALADAPPLAMSALRSVLAAVLVLWWSRARGQALFARDGTLGGGLLAGGMYAATVACTYVGLQYTSAARFVVFLYLSPFVIAFGMRFVNRAERLTPGQMAGLVVAFLGVTLAFADGLRQDARGSTQWLGDLLAVAAAVFWGGTALCVRGGALDKASAEKTLIYQFVVSAPLLALAAWLTGEPLMVRPTAQLYWAFAYQVLVIFFTLLAWFWLLGRYAAAQLAAFTLLTPIFGLLAGVLMLGEPVSTSLLLALLTVSLGILLVNRLPAPAAS